MKCWLLKKTKKVVTKKLVLDKKLYEPTLMNILLNNLNNKSEM